MTKTKTKAGFLKLKRLRKKQILLVLKKRRYGLKSSLNGKDGKFRILFDLFLNDFDFTGTKHKVKNDETFTNYSI